MNNYFSTSGIGRAEKLIINMSTSNEWKLYKISLSLSPWHKHSPPSQAGINLCREAGFRNLWSVVLLRLSRGLLRMLRGSVEAASTGEVVQDGAGISSSPSTLPPCWQISFCHYQASPTHKDKKRGKEVSWVTSSLYLHSNLNSFSSTLQV